jgi:hypothetical protein
MEVYPHPSREGQVADGYGVKAAVVGMESWFANIKSAAEKVT